MKIVRFLLGLALGTFFLYAGGEKLLDPAAFQINIANFQLVPFAIAGALAVFLPWLEIFAGAALILRKPGAAAILISLMAVFTFSIASAWIRGLNIDCGCFGSSDSPTNYPLALLRNSALIAALGTWLWLFAKTAKSPAKSATD